MHHNSTNFKESLSSYKTWCLSLLFSELLARSPAFQRLLTSAHHGASLLGEWERSRNKGILASLWTSTHANQHSIMDTERTAKPGTGTSCAEPTEGKWTTSPVRKLTLRRDTGSTRMAALRGCGRHLVPCRANAVSEVYCSRKMQSFNGYHLVHSATENAFLLTYAQLTFRVLKYTEWYIVYTSWKQSLKEYNMVIFK